MTEQTEAHGVPRRTVMAAAGAVGAAGVLAACSTGNPAPQAAPTQSQGEASKKPAGGSVVATTADVPVGGGMVIDDKMLVVTQPKEGQYKAFTSVCPHEGCTVSTVTADAIICPCHGSQFSAETGDVLRGPAMTGLTPVAIRVAGTDIVAET